MPESHRGGRVGRTPVTRSSGFIDEHECEDKSLQEVEEKLSTSLNFFFPEIERPSAQVLEIPVRC